MHIIELISEDKIKDIVTDLRNKEKLFVIDCGATWCGPCKTFAKFYHDYVSNYPQTNEVVFCKLDIDDVSDFCEVNNITSVPTILFIKNSEVVERMVGADINKFKSILSRWLQKSHSAIQK
jgi:thioredoxin 1